MGVTPRVGFDIAIARGVLDGATSDAIDCTCAPPAPARAAASRCAPPRTNASPRALSACSTRDGTRSPGESERLGGASIVFALRAAPCTVSPRAWRGQW
eukprot:5372817-Prymnesium_polylepis.1